MLLLQTLILITIAQASGIPSGVIDGAMDVNPYGMAVYGFLVLILIIQIYMQNKTINSQRERNDQLVDKALTLMVRLEDRLPTVEKFTDLQNGVNEIKNLISEIKNMK